MASTRNKNSEGDYQLEQRAYQQRFERMSFEHSPYVGHVHGTSYMPGRGLVGGKIAPRIICNNFSDVESELFGIGVTNLTNPMRLPVTPENPQTFQYLDVATIRYPFDIMPIAFAPQANQRPMYLN
jgi:hypothetical protein